MKLPSTIHILVIALIAIFAIPPIYYSTIIEHTEVQSVIFSYYYVIKVTHTDSSIDTISFSILDTPASKLYYSTLDSIARISPIPVVQMEPIAWSQNIIEEYEEK